MNRLEIRIFLSSTFSENMVNARDAFRNEMLAKLNAVAGQIQGNVFLNDFELGIPEGTDALTVVCTCLNAIMESDYFVGIMGEERGTLVSEQARVELENLLLCLIGLILMWIPMNTIFCFLLLNIFRLRLMSYWCMFCTK